MKISDTGVTSVDILNWAAARRGVGGAGKIIIVVVSVPCVVEHGCIAAAPMTDLVK